MNRKPPALSPLFKLIFITAVSLVIVSLITSIAVAYIGTASPMHIALFDTCIDAWKLGVGAILGLIGGRADANQG